MTDADPRAINFIDFYHRVPAGPPLYFLPSTIVRRELLARSRKTDTLAAHRRKANPDVRQDTPLPL